MNKIFFLFMTVLLKTAVAFGAGGYEFHSPHLNYIILFPKELSLNESLKIEAKFAASHFEKSILLERALHEQWPDMPQPLSVTIQVDHGSHAKKDYLNAMAVVQFPNGMSKMVSSREMKDLNFFIEQLVSHVVVAFRSREDLVRVVHDLRQRLFDPKLKEQLPTQEELMLRALDEDEDEKDEKTAFEKFWKDETAFEKFLKVFFDAYEPEDAEEKCDTYIMLRGGSPRYDTNLETDPVVAAAVPLAAAAVPPQRKPSRRR